MKTTLRPPSIALRALAASILFLAGSAAAQVTFYENESFQGRSFSTQKPVQNFERLGFNDRASSVRVQSGRWEICDDARFQGNCVVLRPGSYPSLATMGINNRVSSVRPVQRNARVDDNRFAPAPVPAYGYQRRSDERLYEGRVTSVRAVVGPSEQRCWVEREQVGSGPGGANVPGAIVGGIIGGVLGHQVGGGRGKDFATAGGAVAGAAIGSNVNRGGGGPGYTQDVRRCATVPNDSGPAYWDVTYDYRGKEHRVQMSAAPGQTIAVNAQGEPRS